MGWLTHLSVKSGQFNEDTGAVASWRARISCYINSVIRNWPQIQNLLRLVKMRFATLLFGLAVIACVCSHVVSSISESRMRTTRDLYGSGFNRNPLRAHDDYLIDPSTSKFLMCGQWKFFRWVSCPRLLDNEFFSISRIHHMALPDSGSSIGIVRRWCRGGSILENYPSFNVSPSLFVLA